MKYKTFNNILKLILITSSACYSCEKISDANKENADATVYKSHGYKTRSRDENATLENTHHEEHNPESTRPKRKRGRPPLQPKNVNIAQDSVDDKNSEPMDPLAKRKKTNTHADNLEQYPSDRSQNILPSHLSSENLTRKEHFIVTVRDHLQTGNKPEAKKLVLDALKSTPNWLKDLIDQLSSDEATNIEAEAASIFLYEIFKQDGDHPKEILNELSHLDQIRKNYVAGCAIAFLKDENIVIGHELYNEITMRSNLGAIHTLMTCLEKLEGHPRISAKKCIIDLLESHSLPQNDMGIQGLKHFITLNKAWAKNILVFCLDHRSEKCRDYALKALQLLLQENHSYPQELIRDIFHSTDQSANMIGLNLLERLICMESGDNLESLAWEVIKEHCGEEVVDRYQSSGIGVYTALVDNKHSITQSYEQSLDW